MQEEHSSGKDKSSLDPQNTKLVSKTSAAFFGPASMARPEPDVQMHSAMQQCRTIKWL
jgi:hypothetical protein